MNAFLRSYRSTPQSSTNKSPASLIFISCNTSRLPAKTPAFSTEQQSEILIAEINDKFAKYKMKTYADKRRKAVKSNFKIGDRVIYHQLNNKIHNKYKNQFSNTPYTIKNIKGSMITVTNSNNSQLTRNSSFFKKVSSNLKLDDNISDFDEITTNNRNNNFTPQHQANNNDQSSITQNDNNFNDQYLQPATNNNSSIIYNTRPKRTTKLPKHLNDFIVTMK